MKLYYSPGACSLSPHIALLEAGLSFELIKTDLRAKTLPDGSDYRAVNPKGSVPALALDNGEVLTEGPALVQYIADQAPAKHIAPANGTMARYRLQEWLNFISTELHKGYSPLFRPNTPGEYRPIVLANLSDKYAIVDAHLATHNFVLGDQFSVADAYLFTVTNWAKAVKLDISGLSNLAAFMARVASRPAVQAALKAEGLI